VRRLVTALLLVLLGATGCGGSASTGGTAKARVGTLADVTVSGPTTSKPRVDFKAPLSFATTKSKIVDRGPGTGDAVSPSSRVTLDYVGVNASDGAEFDSSWKRGKPATFGLADVIPGFAQGLSGAHAGDRVLVGIASKDGYDPTGNGSSIRKGDSLVFVVDVRKVQTPLAEATGTKHSAPATVPRLTYDGAGHPAKFVATATTRASVSKLGVYPIIEGNGPIVKSGQSITVEYVGQVYPDGKVFDESWSNDSPVSFPIGTGGLIKGWDQGLVGQHVGSRVILVIPSALGYGATGSGTKVPPNADLIFVIDILQAS
jgi:FKBP-type peptidyl-prolyl cis-trans isomerase